MIAFFADAFVKATVLLLVAAGAAFVLRRSAAALRHLVWALACAGLLALPIASAVLPEWSLSAWPRLDVPVTIDAPHVTGGEQRVPVVIEAATRAVSATPPAVAPAAQGRWRLRPDWTALVVPVWLGGALFILAALAVGLARIAWLTRVGAPLRDGAWLALATELSRSLPLARPVRLLRAAGPAMPMTWGVRRPVILLPADADTWPLDRRRDVLLHELAHVKRLDFLTQLLARVACAVYWFHPLVWLAAARLRVERERACDDHVLRAGAKPSAYAAHLLEIARALRPAPGTALASVAMARPAQLATRLLDVLDAHRCRDAVSPRRAVPAWLAAIAVVLPLGAVAPRVGERVAPPQSPPPAVSVTVQPAVAKPKIVLIVDTLRGCGTARRRGVSMSHRVEDNVQTIVTTTGNCSITLDADAEFTFNEDFTDIASVGDGGRVMITVDYGARDRRITFEPAPSGVTRVYKVDGTVRPIDAEARAWLAETLTFLLRRTGYAAEDRARWILERGGVQGLLDEIARLGGDYARRRYFQIALASGQLDAAAYERLVDDAGRTISSDYELAELLIAVAQAQALTERMQASFARAARTLGSDYERRRVLQAALTRPHLSATVQVSMLEAAAAISSDYELAELLIALTARRRIDEPARAAFFKAANSLQSDYEHRRVLTAVVEGASREVLVDMLESAKTIGSDYELAQLLSDVGAKYLLDEALRPAFFAAAATIGSDYEHARALLSVVRRDSVPAAVSAAVVESSRDIQSDYHMAEVLLAVIRNVTLTDALRTAIDSVAGTLGSQYERGRVRDALGRRRGRADLE